MSERAGAMALRSVPVDELTVTVVVDNETDTLSSVDAGVPQTQEAAGLVARASAQGLPGGHSGVAVFDQLCVACHGLSLLLTARVGDRSSTVLFDAGPYGDVWLTNARRLNVDLASIDTVVLSHWHWDHSGALPVVLKAIGQARTAVGMSRPVVIDIHPDRPDQRGVKAPAGTLILLPPEPTEHELQATGANIDRHGEDHLLAGGNFFISGPIARITAYETGLTGHHSIRGGEVIADPLLMDERYLAAEVRDRGVAVFSACSHAGIINVCRDAAARYASTSIDFVFGGFHLAGAAMEQRIPATIEDLADRIGPRLVAPAHCTGWRAKAALAQRFAPGRYAPSAVGSRYSLIGAP